MIWTCQDRISYTTQGGIWYGVKVAILTHGVDVVVCHESNTNYVTDIKISVSVQDLALPWLQELFCP